MKQYQPLKQKLAAALALAMLGTGLPLAAWSEGEPPSDPQPPVVEILADPQPPVVEIPADPQPESDSWPQHDEQSSKSVEPKTQFFDASAEAEYASLDTASDGAVYGRVEFSGTNKMVIELFHNGSLISDKVLSSGSFSFDGLMPGSYVLKFYFWGEGHLPPQKELSVTVGFNDVAHKETTPPPSNVELITPPPSSDTETTPPPSDVELITPPPSDDTETTPPPSDVELITPPPSGDTETTPPPSDVELITPPPSGDTETTPPPSGVELITPPPSGDTETTPPPSGVELITPPPSGVELITPAPSDEPEKPAFPAIQIIRVRGGENLLTVTGKAQPGAQLMIYAEPGTALAEVVTADADGSFIAYLLAEPGIYDRVVAYYVPDLRTAASVVGYFEVTAPFVQPTLTVDPVDTNSTKVVAKTSPGVKVTLRTNDTEQTLVADSEGIVRFSLAHTYLKDDVFILIVTYDSSYGEQSFSQKVTIQGSAHYSTLEYGDSGDAVTRLTGRLAELGYPVSTTSRYGSTVREAVRLFQVANGLRADGRANHTTQTVLYSVGAIRYSSNKYPTLVRGDRDIPLIYTLQERLKELGYYTIKVDGIFGSGTERAVRLFQQVNGLSVTGKADNATQTLLYSDAAKPLGSGAQDAYKTLSRSNHYNSAVVPLQRRLKSLGYAVGSIDGYFGSQTYRAVRSFQSRNGLNVTGIADPYTQQVLYSSSARPASGSSSSTGYRLLYWGCRGDDVKRLQNALISAGYKSLVRKADGIYGQWTYDAVCAFQKDHGLAVDGIAGKNTQNKLYGTRY